MSVRKMITGARYMHGRVFEFVLCQTIGKPCAAFRIAEGANILIERIDWLNAGEEFLAEGRLARVREAWTRTSSPS